MPCCSNHVTATCVGIEITLLLGKDLVEHLVDQAKRCADGHCRAVCLNDPRVTREDRHPWPDCRLCEINWGDVPMLQHHERLGKLTTECVHDVPPSGETGANLPRPANENDRGCEGTSSDCDAPSGPLCPHRPRPSNSESVSQETCQHRVPASRSQGGINALRLLERIEQCQRVLGILSCAD